MNQNLQADTKQPANQCDSTKLSSISEDPALNLIFVKQIMCAQLSGKVILPHGLGLDKTSYQKLRKAVNDKYLMAHEIQWYKDDWTLVRERALLCRELFTMKAPERKELITLLCHRKNKQDPWTELMAVIVATACLTKFHLWESLGLETRAQLGKLIKHNFPTLHALNTENMRWKRFFYRQLCAEDGDYICKSPSCEECKSYTECFA
ncbi:MAG: nitrogen fixation protein NifQ [Oleiphilaceae bacterium]|jgi:nitrogen fixation protein NifQ